MAKKVSPQSGSIPLASLSTPNTWKAPRGYLHVRRTTSDGLAAVAVIYGGQNDAVLAAFRTKEEAWKFSTAHKTQYHPSATAAPVVLGVVAKPAKPAARKPAARKPAPEMPLTAAAVAAATNADGVIVGEDGQPVL